MSLHPKKMTPVESSNIKGIGYHEPSRTLYVEFKSGKLYHYPKVSPEEHAALLASDSKGKHLHEHFSQKATALR